MAGVEDRGRDYRLLARAGLYGALAASALFYVLVLASVGPYRASEVAFSLSALAFAFGLTGWSGVVMSGEAIEAFSKEFGITENWTAKSGRQAMALVTVFGLGGMIGAALAARPYGV